jgi:surface carbohydrate biosynthesis protein (TIGR04326 family)
MQAWEKALLLAKNKINSSIVTYAFQHTVVMRNYFNYFYHANETKRTGHIVDLPLPNHLLANGKTMFALLSESNYPSLGEAEAIRQLYIKKMSSAVPKEKSEAILFIAGSYDKVETKSLITLVYHAFPEAQDFAIWFKGSPVNPFEPLFKELKIDYQKAGYRIVYNDLSELLPCVSIALVANTTVAIEVLACKCQLIIPLFADTMLMNPVIDTNATYHFVSQPQELQKIVMNLLKDDHAENNEKNALVLNDYWNLDDKLPRWSKLLTL